MSNPISVLTSAAVLAAVVLTGCDSDQPTSTPSPAPTSDSTTASSPTESSPTESSPTESNPTESSPSSTPTETPSPAARLIDYTRGKSVGVEVQDRADTSKLRGAPAAFKRFIGRTAERLADQSTCDGAYVGVTVELVRTDGYALGGVNDCGGYVALWAVVDGKWKEIGGTQDVWGCRLLDRYGVPSDIAGDKCYDAADRKVRKYHKA